MAIFHPGRTRLRTDLLQRLRALAPRILERQEQLEDLIEDYNGVLRQVRALQDVVLDDLEDAQDQGRGPGPIDFCHYFWARADFADYALPDIWQLDEAERLEALPADS